MYCTTQRFSSYRIELRFERHREQRRRTRTVERAPPHASSLGNAIWVHHAMIAAAGVPSAYRL
jgi:hypothetical protein